MSDTFLYRVKIQPGASPAEVHEFTELLETEGYEVVTDLEVGKLDIHKRGGGSE